MQEHVFRTGITLKLAFACFVAMVPAILLIYRALKAYEMFSPNDPSRFLFVLPPIAVAIVIIVFFIYVTFHFTNRSITISDRSLSYKDSKTQMALDVTTMAFGPPGSNSPFATLMFSDGKTFIQIPKLFMKTKQFEKLVELIKKPRQSSRTTASQKTYSL